jgi:tetratricopeptide (TPR) repeat protein
MRRAHDFLIQSRGWALAHMDRNAYVYVKKDAVAAAWLDGHEYRFYHPVTFPGLRLTADQTDTLRAELERAADVDPRYTRPLLDLGRLLLALGDRPRALDTVNRVLALDAQNREALSLKKTLARGSN